MYIRAKAIFPIYVIFFTITIFPLIAACGSPAFSDSVLPHGQSAALLPSARKDASELPDIPHYDIKLDVDIEDASYRGNAKINYTNLEDTGLKSLFFRLFPNGGETYGEGLLEVSSVKVDGRDVQTHLSLDDSVLEVVLAQPVSIEKHILVSIDFYGIVPVDFRGGGYGIYNLKEEVLSLAGWFPMLAVYDDQGWNLDPVSSIGDSVYSDIAYYTVEFTVPEGMEHAATGSLIDEKESTGFTYNKYISGPVRDFFIVMGKDLRSKSKKACDTMINTYYLPGHEDEADMTLETAVGSLKTFNEKFGEYPYIELDIVEVPMNGAIAVEFPGIVIMGSTVYGNEVFTSHEIAHQWWYNLVGNDVINEPWIDEALTTYSSIIYYEYNRTGSEYRQVLKYFKDEYEKGVTSGNDDIVTKGLSHFEELGGSHYNRIVYSKGAVFYHNLREKIGDRAFFQALKDYYATKKYGIAYGDDLLDRFEKHSGMDLDDFYQEWLYSKK